ncbi:hypothetical protein X975_05495, partial [Stegodyphus mimosarum]
MSLSKNYLLECLAADKKTTIPLKEQCLPKIAIRLCLYSELRNYIFRAPQQNLQASNWEQRNFEELSKIIINILILPSDLHEKLLSFIHSVKRQLIFWINHLEKFTISHDISASVVTPGDWTVEGIINARGIAKRLVIDGRIPVFHRYRIACSYSLENSIVSLWNLIPPAHQQALVRPSDTREFWVITVWSHYLSGLKTKQECLFDSFLLAAIGGEITTMIHCCKALDKSSRQNKVINAALVAVQGIYCNSFSLEMSSDESQMLLLSYTDILCILLSQMTSEERLSFFRRVLYLEHFPEHDHCILESFLQQPFQSIFMPLITELKNILNVQVFHRLHAKIANMKNCCFDKNAFECLGKDIEKNVSLYVS